MIKNPAIVEVAHYINNVSKAFLGAVFLFAAIAELFTDNDYASLIKRTFLAAALLISFEGMLFKGIKYSFVFSQQLLTKFNSNNPLVLNFLSTDKIAKDKALKEKLRKEGKSKPGIWDKVSIMAKALISDGLSLTLWIFIYFCFVLLQNIYSIVLYLLWVFSSVIALFSIIRFTEKAIVGGFNCFLTLLFTPPVIAVIIIIMGNNAAFIKDDSGTIIQDLQALLQLLIVALILLSAPLFAAALSSGSGIDKVGNNLAKAGVGLVMSSGMSIASQSLFKVSKIRFKSLDGIFGKKSNKDSKQEFTSPNKNNANTKSSSSSKKRKTPTDKSKNNPNRNSNKSKGQPTNSMNDSSNKDKSIKENNYRSPDQVKSPNNNRTNKKQLTQGNKEVSPQMSLSASQQQTNSMQSMPIRKNDKFYNHRVKNRPVNKRKIKKLYMAYLYEATKSDPPEQYRKKRPNKRRNQKLKH